MRAQHAKVMAYINGPEFRARVEARRARARAAGAGGNRGIIVNAGGSKLLASAAVTLAVLRRELNCTLPVELVWHGSDEMDARTLAAFEREFAPLRGYDIAAEPYPKHHRQRK